MSSKVNAMPEWVKQRVENLQTENSRLEATIKATQAQRGAGDALLVQIAEALQLADLAADPQKGRNMEDSTRRSSTIPMPGADTRPARNARRRLRAALNNAVQAFSNAADNHWHTPSTPRAERVRCRNTTCVAKDVRIPKFVGPQGNNIELVRCPKCDGTLTPA